MENYIYGYKPIYELLLNNPKRLSRIFILGQAQNQKFIEILKICRDNKIQVAFVEKDWFNKNLYDCNHQNIAGIIDKFEYVDFDQLATEKPKGKHRLIVVLDSITDPQNLGSIIRSIESVGIVSGVILQENRSAKVTGSVYKASAGAVLFVPIAIVNNITQALIKLKEDGFWIIGTDVNSKDKYYDFKFDCDIALVIGSEGKGMRDLVKKNCDFLISIPLYGRTQSLNVSVASGIILFHIARLWNS